MKVLICAAEEEELIVARQGYEQLTVNERERLDISWLLTGIGTTSTSYRLTKAIAQSPHPLNLAINVGIAGSFSPQLPLGSVSRVAVEYFGDLGFETFQGFQTLFDYKILDANTHPFRDGKLIAPKLSNEIEKRMAPYGNSVGVTVQTVSGIPERKELLIEEFNPQIESMEGAAFFYVSTLEEIPFIELRSVSNEVGERDRSKWNIPLALENLREAIRTLLEGLANET
ncbi:MAG: futalosine hydrolase [Bacteroidales bacterium]